jgi:hypothetical protein
MSAPLSMGDVEALISQRCGELIVGHEFMRRLEGDADLRALRRLLPRLGIFPFAFQDMLSLATDMASDPVLAPIIRSLRAGDHGHDGWYVLDLEDHGIKLGAYEAFGQEHEVVRRVAYSLIGFIAHARCDHARLAVLLTMEAAAREFFLRIQGFAKRAGVSRELRYFGGTHLEAEEAHEVFSEDAQAQLTNIIVPVEHRDEVLETVEKSFQQMLRFAEELASATRA